MTGPRAGKGGSAPLTATVPELIADIVRCGGTQSHIARILNVDEALITRWKNGHGTPGPLRLAMLQQLHEQVTAW